MNATRFKRLAALVAVLCLAVPVFAQQSVRPLAQIGKQAISPASVSIALTVPSGAQAMEFSVTSGPVYINADATAAAATDVAYTDGNYGVFNNSLDLAKLRFYCTACTVSVRYYGAR